MQAFNDLLRELLSSVPSRRLANLRVLEREADPANLERFCLGAKNLQISVCLELCGVLSHALSKPFVKLLGHYAMRGEPVLSERALQALENIPPTARSDCLLELLQSDLSTVREAACRLLGQANTPLASNDLVQMLADSETDVVIAALNALQRLHFTEAIGKIENMLEHKSKDVRILSIEILLDFTSPEKFPLAKIIKLLEQDENSEVKKTCCWALGKHPSPEGSRVLRKIVAETTDIKLLPVVASALADHHNAANVRTLLKRSASDSHPASSLSCRRALNKIPENLILQAGKSLLQEDDLLLRLEVAGVLGELTSGGVCNLLLERLSVEKEVVVRAALVEALGHGGWSEVWDTVRNCASEDTLVAYAAINALADLLCDEHLENFAKLLFELEDDTLKEAIIKRINLYSSRHNLPQTITDYILPLLKSKSANLPSQAAEALGYSKNQALAKPLAESLHNSRDQLLIESACRSLARLANNSAWQLFELLGKSYLEQIILVIKSMQKLGKDSNLLFQHLSLLIKNNDSAEYKCLKTAAMVAPEALVACIRETDENTIPVLIKIWQEIPPQSRKNNPLPCKHLLASTSGQIISATLDSLPNKVDDNTLSMILDIALHNNSQPLQKKAREKVKKLVERESK